MPVCTRHGEFYKNYCLSCNRENIELAKKSSRDSKKKKPIFGKTYSLSEKSERRDKLKKKLQAAWRAAIFPFYEKKGLTSRCWITGKPLIKQKGANRLWGPQVSHFYDKGTIWQLWCDPVNSGICSYDTNVNNPQTVASMESKMVEVWGKERVEELKRKKEMYDMRIKTGQDPRYPTEEWLIEMAKYCKVMIIE